MAQIQAGETFVTGQQFTALRANNHVGGATLLSGAITEQVVPGVAIVPADILVLCHSTLRNRLEKISANELLTSAVNITASGNIAATGNITSTTGSIVGKAISIVDGTDHTISASGPAVSITADSDIYISTPTATVQCNAFGGLDIQSSGGEITIENTFTPTPPNTHNIIIDGNVDFSSSAYVNFGTTEIRVNGVNVTGKLGVASCYDEVVELKANFSAIRGTNAGNTSSANFNVAYPTGANAIYSDTVAVPAGEKWIVEYEVYLHNEVTDDGMLMAWVYDGNIEQFSTGSERNATFFYNSDLKYIKVIDNTAGVSTLSKTIQFKFGFDGGTGGDIVRFGGFKGRSTSAVYSTAVDLFNNTNWVKKTRKYKI